MSGNVWEWVEDKWHDNYKGAPEDGLAWNGVSGDRFRVLRGGGMTSHATFMRSAGRIKHWPDFRRWEIGFRLAQDL